MKKAKLSNNNQTLNASIESISREGIVEVGFNKDIIKFANFSIIDESVLDVKVLPE